LLARLDAADVVASPIRDIDDLEAWPLMRARRMIQPLVHPLL
jgi:crotonobetainyl-CoA:carnitine CoA-transferase CaiB-like acyl-CoA transferase